eukprot:TRINITY_DN4849_c0_g1_i1.p1 TRINITY_DN4849_c0_g1~~TRINITY_DN4849_c0_g1_i1.p1  ORF type:complete len:271 (+),score=15.03 TRINITY_DN4849_c0_g1_i1:105-917(+)
MTSFNSTCQLFLNKLIHEYPQNDNKNNHQKQSVGDAADQRKLNVGGSLSEAKNKLEFLQQYNLKKLPQVAVDYQGLTNVVTNSCTGYSINRSHSSSCFCPQRNQVKGDVFDTWQRTTHQFDEENIDQNRLNLSATNDRIMTQLAAAFQHFQRSEQSFLNRVKQIRRMEDEVLFFIFYNQPQTLLQYQAACELTRRKWRLHEKFCMWFRRVNIPTEVTDEQEVCDVEYWNYCPKEQLEEATKYGLTCEGRPRWEISNMPNFIFEYKFMVIP